jgi:hypothetical protein
MKKPIAYLTSMLLVLTIFFSPASAADQEAKGENRLLNTGTVLKKILDVPDDNPSACSTRQIVLSRQIAAPPGAQTMISTLDSRTPRHKS